MTGPRHLPLEDQYDYTAGQCAGFAWAVQAIMGGVIHVLYKPECDRWASADEEMDAVHVFVMLQDGRCVDAEGARSLRSLLASFGALDNGSEVVADPAGELVRKEWSRQHDAEYVGAIKRLLEEHGWGQEAPRADNRLSRHFERARRRAEDRAELRYRSKAPGLS